MLFTLPLFSQWTANPANQELLEIRVKKVAESPQIDGLLEEDTWSDLSRATRFWQRFPQDSVRASGETEISFVYDEQNLYVAIKCYTSGKDLITPSLKRDYSFMGSDNITLLFDSYADKNNAFVFGINPYGVRREALVSNGGVQPRDFDTSWDNRWDGEAQIFDNYWTAEILIPFKTLRFKKGSQQWRFNAYRNDSQYNEITSWSNIPQNRMPMDLNYMGQMIWEEPLAKTGKNISIIPYVAGSVIRDFEDTDQSKAVTKGAIGGDAKIGLTSGLNLDLTINPDFSQVEVDRQVTNLDRFEILFPERRQFFLENADLFGAFGAQRVNPFFSRRIGVAVDTSTNENIQNAILYGARLSGKLNKKLRIGLLNMQSAQQLDNDLPSFNYTVATAQQNIFDRSVIGFMLVNKQALNPNKFSGSFENFNRVGALEYRLLSADNRWIGKATYQHSFTPDQQEAPSSFFSSLVFNNRKFRFEWVNLYVGNGFDPEVGFAPRKDIYLISPEASIDLYPTNGKVSRHRIGFDASVFFKPGKDGSEYLPKFGVEEWEIVPFWNIEYTNSAQLRFELRQARLTLLDAFDPTRVQEDSIELAAGTTYDFTDFTIDYRSDQRQKFSFNFRPIGGTFYNGYRAGINGRFSYRFQPYGSVAMAYTYNYIRLKEPFVPVNLWLVGPRIDLTFTKKIFLTTFIQYNNQSDNLNINARFQWRFKPVSDFFVVYTDNYETGIPGKFGSRNRALVAKFTYWLNL